MYSQAALKICAAKKAGIIKSNAQFWREFCTVEKLNGISVDTDAVAQELNVNAINLICAFDENFPELPERLKSSDKPYLFAYKGDISLLEDIAKNVAVIGVLTPTQDIVKRETEIVRRLADKNLNIVSGLANGCDTVAHKECLAHSGRTIAFLPTTLTNIYPKENACLAGQIVSRGGLAITEYVAEPSDRYERIKRFIERDRLQAMFSERIILIASYAQGQGDSGSRHAMAKAKKYGKKRFVIYKEQTDFNNPLFGLNRQLIDGGVAVLTPKMLNEF